MLFQEELETMSPQRRAALQSDRLIALLERLHRVDSRFWSDKLSGTPPEAISSVDDLERLPFTTKSEMRDTYPFGMLAVPLEETVRIHASSGTRGRPTIVVYTRRDISTFADVNARSIACAGGTPDDVLHVAYGYGLFTGG
ncbi:MAG: phenylacetate--CoA ligase family protein, partial [Actinomycetota bacterium]